MSASTTANDYTIAGVNAWAEEKFPSAFAAVKSKSQKSHLWFGNPGELDRAIYEDCAMLNNGMYVTEGSLGEIRYQLFASLRKDGRIDFTGAKYYDFHTEVHYLTNEDLHKKCEFKFLFRASVLIDSETVCIRRLKSLCMYFFLKSDKHSINEFKNSKYIKPTFFKQACEKVEAAMILGVYDKRDTMENLRQFMQQRQQTVVVADEDTEDEA